MPGLDHAPTDTEIRSAVSRLNNSAPGDSGVVLWSPRSSRRSSRQMAASGWYAGWYTTSGRQERCTNLLAILAKIEPWRVE
eukprot:6588761-Prymnesium_polylepis.1